MGKFINKKTKIMKKSTQLKNWLSISISKLFNKVFGLEKPEPKKNEQAIMDLLFKSNFTDLELEDSLNIYTSIEAKFREEIQKRKERKIAELSAIRGFENFTNDHPFNITSWHTFDTGNMGKMTINEIKVKEAEILQAKVKEHVNNQVFSVPLANLQFDKKE
jgi:hypothetical protein